MLRTIIVATMLLFAALLNAGEPPAIFAVEKKAHFELIHHAHSV